MLQGGGASPQKISEISATAKVKVGTRGVDPDNGNEYIYALADGAITINEAVALAVVASGATTLEARPLTEAIGVIGCSIGVAPVAVTDDYYAWFQIVGAGVSIDSNASNTADTLQYCTTTAGSIDNAGTTAIHGLSVQTGIASSKVVATIFYPHTAN